MELCEGVHRSLPRGVRPAREWLIRFLELSEDWKYLIHRMGYVKGFSRVGRDILALPYRHMKYVVVARSLTVPLPDWEFKAPLEMRRFGPEDLDLVRLKNMPSEARLCVRRLELGHYGLAACSEGELAGYAWGCTDTSLEKIDVPFESGDVLCTDAFTFPAFRRMGVQTALTLARLRFFGQMGYKRAIAYIELHNAPSLAVWHKMEAHQIARIDFRRMGLWRRTSYC